MEDERIDLKLQLRKIAQRTGQRAVALGLTADDLLTIEQFTEELKTGKTETVRDRKRVEAEKLKIRSDQLSSDLGSEHKMVENIGEENRRMRTKLAKLETENVKLQQGLKEIRRQLKTGEATIGGNGQTLECPTLDKLLNVSPIIHF